MLSVDVVLLKRAFDRGAIDDRSRVNGVTEWLFHRLHRQEMGVEVLGQMGNVPSSVKYRHLLGVARECNAIVMRNERMFPKSMQSVFLSNAE